jgi:hypothetical protein
MPAAAPKPTAGAAEGMPALRKALPPEAPDGRDFPLGQTSDAAGGDAPCSGATASPGCPR